MSEIIPQEYQITLRVASYDVDSADRMRLSAVLRYQQEAGEQHLGLAGLGWRQLCDWGMAFVCSRWHAVVHRLPRMEETVTLTTWHRERRGPRFFRCYEWRDAEGNLLIEGVMLFALVDTVCHRLLRGDEFMELAPLPDSQRQVSCSDTVRFVMKDAADAGTYEVHWSDIDRNGHMNNTRYADLMWDFMPAVWQDREPVDVQLHFAGESRMGDTLSLCASMESIDAVCVAGDTDRGRTFAARITFRD